MRRSFPLGLAVVLTVASVFHVHAATGVKQAAGAGWRLGAAYYPATTRIVAKSGVSNAALQTFAGSLHASSYATLGRIEGSGWLQVGTFTKSTEHGKVRLKHVIDWSYAVSSYPTAAAALHAVQDIRRTLQPLSGGGPYGRSARFSNGAGDRETVSTVGVGTNVIELLCTLRKSDVRQFGRLLGQYCSEQRVALYRLTTLESAGTSSTPGVIPSDTPIGTLSAPMVSFYTQGSHDTCLLSGRTTSFPNTAPEMFVQALFTDWRGDHQIVYEWYAPDGSLFYNTSYAGTDLGAAVLCAWMSIGNTDAANLPGIWTLRLRIDGQESAAATFSLTDARTPAPAD